MKKKLLLIIPAYNEEGSLKAVVDNIINNFPQYDYVVVNDGSMDHTEQICIENGYSHINHPVNLGLTCAFRSGMKYAYKYGYEYAMQIDADGQHDPAFIAKMLEAAENGYDIVIGSRFVDEKKQHSLRMLGNSMISTAIKMTTGAKITDPTSGMRLYGKRVIREFVHNYDFGPEPDTISYLIKRDMKVKEIQVSMGERTSGESYLNFSKSVFYMMRMMTSILIFQAARNEK